MINCISYSPSIDLVYKLYELIPGNTYTGAAPVRNVAGKAVNVARVISQLGENPFLTGIMPKNDAEQYSKYLSEKNIESSFFEVEGSVRINTTILESKTGATTHLSSNSPSLSVRIQDELEQFVSSQFKKGDTWIISGSLPAGFDKNAYAQLISIGKTMGVNTILDTRGEALKHGVRACPTIIKPNLTELEQFFDEEIQGIHHIALKGKRLIDMGIEYVFISLGSDGMIAIHGNDCLLCSPPQVDTINTVGSGDALVAGIAVARERGFSFQDMCKLAIASGTSNAMLSQTGEIDNDRIWKLMEDVTIESV